MSTADTGNAVKMAGLIALELEDRRYDQWSVTVNSYDEPDDDVVVVRTPLWSVSITAAEVKRWRGKSATQWINTARAIVSEQEVRRL